MSGSTFLTKGTGGAVQNSVFFGAIADRFTMLRPMHLTNASGGTVFEDSQFSASLINQWTPFNSSYGGGSNVQTVTLGATTTAPDNSSNAQKIVAGTANDQHSMWAGIATLAGQSGRFKLRLAVFAKAAEYTRFALYIQTGENFTTSAGAKTVFDLAGVQIGVANTLFGSASFPTTPWIVGPTTITAFSNGFCLCTMDVTVGDFNTSSYYLIKVALDAGSGTAAENTSFAGDGTSGIYFWKSTCLPPAAFGMGHSQVFLDDFNDPTLANFDLANTKAPGFTWYINNVWPNSEFTFPAHEQPSNPAQFSASGSILTLQENASFDTQLNMMTAVYNGSSAVVSHTFQPPFLFECKSAYDTNVNGYTGAGPTFWTTNIERLLDVTGLITENELDCFEAQPGGSEGLTPGVSGFAGPHFALHCFGGASYIGYPVWQPNFSYQMNNILYYAPNATLYQALTSSNQGNVPPSSPSNWQVYSIPATKPTLGNSKIADFTQQHLYSTLYLPATANDVGQVLLFFDNIFCDQSQFIYGPVYGPAQNAGRQNVSANFQLGDAQHYPNMLGVGTNANMYIDYVSVRQ